MPGTSSATRSRGRMMTAPPTSRSPTRLGSAANACVSSRTSSRGAFPPACQFGPSIQRTCPRLWSVALALGTGRVRSRTSLPLSPQLLKTRTAVSFEGTGLEPPGSRPPAGVAPGRNTGFELALAAARHRVHASAVSGTDRSHFVYPGLPREGMQERPGAAVPTALIEAHSRPRVTHPREHDENPKVEGTPSGSESPRIRTRRR